MNEQDHHPLLHSQEKGADRSPASEMIGKSSKDKTYGTATSKPSGPYSGPDSITFCVHGNKYEMGGCCYNLLSLEVGKIEDNQKGIWQEQDVEGLVKNQKTRSFASLNQALSLLSKFCNTDIASYDIDKRAVRKLILASILCIFFVIVETVGGILANSLAIAADAAHLLTDFASFMISLFAIWVASKPPTQRMSYGWLRAEVVGATVSVLLIWVLTGILVYGAVLRIYSGDYELNPTIMLITSAVGLGVNMLMGATLHQHGHSHGGDTGDKEDGHGHSHGGSKGDKGHGDVKKGGEKPKKQTGPKNDSKNEDKENINVKAALIHVIGDFLSSLGVFIAALVIYFKPEWKIVDPICTFLFSVLVLCTTINVLRNTMTVLMEGIPADVKFEVVEQIIMSVPGIVTLHNLRIWSLTTAKTALSAHIVIAPVTNPHQILKEASRRIREKYDIFEMTIQIEEFQEETSTRDEPFKIY